MSSSLTEPSGTELAGVETSSSQTWINSEISNARISRLLAWCTRNLKKNELSPSLRSESVTVHEALMLAGDGTLACVPLQMGNVNTSTCARVAREDTKFLLALEGFERREKVLEGRGRFERENKGGDWEEGDMGFMPKYKRGFIFSGTDPGGSWATGCTEFELPVPWPPAKEFENSEAVVTIEGHPKLFKITTPIKIDIFEEYLVSHPNLEFVASMVTALKEGFWPWVDTQPEEEFPGTWDNACMSPRSVMKQQFISRYRDEEIAAGCFSEPFGPDLLPGMYSMPVHAVPKPHSEDFWMVSNMSAGLYAPNRMIRHSDIAGLHLDSLHMLFSAILRYWRRSPGNKRKILVVFKSDVSKAYRLCPMHLLWQLKQVVMTGYLTSEQKAAGDIKVLVRTINYNNNFGGRGSGQVWYSVNGLITWVAINIENIEDLGCYVDDDFSFDKWGDLEYYVPYDTYYPSKQTRLLKLWDRLGVPHSKSKQLFSLQLVIIGFKVDPNAMTATMPEESKADLVYTIRHFALSNRRNLQEYQQIVGWSNWAFNIFPLLKPGLCNLYAKMQGKTNPFAGIALNNTVKEDLNWLADHIEESKGICCFDSMDWDPILDATISILCEACLDGMGFWILRIACGFVCPTPKLPDGDKVIFFFEALCICAAIHWVANTLSPELRRRVTIFTDNTNTVDIFSSLRASPTYNPILKSAVDVLISHDMDLQVLHIPGSENNIVVMSLDFRGNGNTNSE